MERLPAVAGYFYPASEKALRETVEQLFDEVERKRFDAVAGIAPHAGYVYSGRLAAQTFYSYRNLDEMDLFLLLGPSHHFPFQGFRASLIPWRTPLGKSEPHPEITKKILLAWDIEVDEEVHAPEHSLEVLLPFLQTLAPEMKILPILTGQLEYQDLFTLSSFLNHLQKNVGLKVGVIVSSDFTHYEPASMALIKDARALEYIRRFDALALLRDSSLSVCGRAPIACILEWARGRGEPVLLARTDSSEKTGDRSSVVSYVSLLFKSS